MFKSQQQLQVMVEHARDELLRISRSLVDDGCIELWNLVNEIGEIQKSPLIEEFGTAFAGFCSQIGRLASVMSRMGKIGGAACEAVKRNGDAVDSKSSNRIPPMNAEAKSFDCTKQLLYELETYVQEFSRLGTELQWLCEKDVQFIVCDAHVLNDHPELVQADAVRTRFATSTAHLETLSDAWWRFAEEIKEKGGAYESALAAHCSPLRIN